MVHHPAFRKKCPRFDWAPPGVGFGSTTPAGLGIRWSSEASLPERRVPLSSHEDRGVIVRCPTHGEQFLHCSIVFFGQPIGPEKRRCDLRVMSTRPKQKRRPAAEEGTT